MTKKLKLQKMDETESWKRLTMCIFSTLNAAGKNGCSFNELKSNFRKDWKNGLDSVVKELQCSDLQMLLKAMPEKVQIFKHNGENWAKALSVKECSKVSELIEETLQSKSRHKNSRHQNNRQNDCQSSSSAASITVPNSRFTASMSSFSANSASQLLNSGSYFSANLSETDQNMLFSGSSQQLIQASSNRPLLDPKTTLPTSQRNSLYIKTANLMMLGSIIYDLCSEHGSLPISAICGAPDITNNSVRLRVVSCLLKFFDSCFDLQQANGDIVVRNKKISPLDKVAIIGEDVAAMNTLRKISDEIHEKMVFQTYVINSKKSFNQNNLNVTFIRSSSMPSFNQMKKLLKEYLEFVDDGVQCVDTYVPISHPNDYLLFKDPIVGLCRVRVLEVLKHNEVKVVDIDSNVQFLVNSEKKLLSMPEKMMKFPDFSIQATFESQFMERFNNVEKMGAVLKQFIDNRTEVTVVVQSIQTVVPPFSPKFVIKIYKNDDRNPGASPAIYPNDL